MPESANLTKTWKAGLISPLVAPALYFVGVLLFTETATSAREVSSAFFGIMFFGLPLSYMGMVILGIPYYRLLEKNNWMSLTKLVVGGTVFGAAVLGLFAAAIVGFDGMWRVESIGTFAIGGGLGLAVSFVFGKMIGITRRSSGHRTLRAFLRMPSALFRKKPLRVWRR